MPPLRTVFTAACLVALFATGCAPSPAPMNVKLADIENGALAGYDGKRTVIIELFPGERLPVDFQLIGDGFELDPHPPMQLVVKEHGYVRIGRDGIRIARDPDHFDDKPRVPGSFRLGFGAPKGERPKITVVVEAPRR